MTDYTLSGSVDIKNSSLNAEINVFASGSSNSVNLRTPSLSGNVDFTLPSTAGTTGQFLQRTGANSLSWVNGGGGGGGGGVGRSLPILIFTGRSTIPMTGTAVLSGTQVWGSIIYSGTNIEPAPVSLSMVFTGTITGSSLVMQLQNFSNGNVVMASITVPVNVAYTNAIFTTTTFTNVPTGRSILRLIKAGTSASGQIFSFTLR